MRILLIAQWALAAIVLVPLGYFGISYYEYIRYVGGIHISISYKSPSCGESHPMAIKIVNTASKTLKTVDFTINGYANGQRIPAVRSQYLAYGVHYSIPPGESLARCWGRPRQNYDAPGSVPIRADEKTAGPITVEPEPKDPYSDWTWKATDISAKFE